MQFWFLNNGNALEMASKQISFLVIENCLDSKYGPMV